MFRNLNRFDDDGDSQFDGAPFIDQETADGIRKALLRTDLTDEDRQQLQSALAKLTGEPDAVTTTTATDVPRNATDTEPSQ